ncbi:MAG: hypothetical protein H0U57_12535 [Tatlockia sp.]|nr:hypothetical protein [Tatlockia sp.]
MFAKSEKITQEKVTEWYKKIYSLVKEQQVLAQKENKKLFIALGEQHRNDGSLFFSYLFIDIAKNLGINNLLVELSPPELNKLRGEYEEGCDKIINLQFLFESIITNKMTLTAIENNVNYLEIVEKMPEKFQSNKFYLVNEKKDPFTPWTCFISNDTEVSEFGLFEANIYYLLAGKKFDNLTVTDKEEIQEKIIAAFGEPIEPLKKDIEREVNMGANIKNFNKDALGLVGFNHLKALENNQDLRDIYRIFPVNIANLDSKTLNFYLNKPSGLSTIEENYANWIKESTLYAIGEPVPQLALNMTVPPFKALEKMIETARNDCEGTVNLSFSG